MAQLGSQGVQTDTQQQLDASTAGNAAGTGVGTGLAGGTLRQEGGLLVPDGLSASATSQLSAQNANQGDSAVRLAERSAQAARLAGAVAAARGAGVPVVAPVVTTPVVASGPVVTPTGHRVILGLPLTAAAV